MPWKCFKIHLAAKLPPSATTALNHAKGVEITRGTGNTPADALKVLPPRHLFIQQEVKIIQQ